jgi:hypothetical protein
MGSVKWPSDLIAAQNGKISVECSSDPDTLDAIWGVDGVMTNETGLVAG